MTLNDITQTSAGSGGGWRDSQLRWLGPEKGVSHLALDGLVNAVWDLYAKAEGKPLWKLLADMTPRQTGSCIDFRYITDALTPDEALEILTGSSRRRPTREPSCCRSAIPPTRRLSAGWAIPTRRSALCREAIAEGLDALQGQGRGRSDDDARRVGLVREAIGPDRTLMVDANQRWDVGEAIARMRELAQFNPCGSRSRRARTTCWGMRRSRAPSVRSAWRPASIAPIASCSSSCSRPSDRLLPDRQLPLGGVNENLAVMLMAAKFGVPVSRTPAVSGSASWCSTCRCSTTSRSPD